MRQASFTSLRCDVRASGDDLVVQLLLDYELPDGQNSTLAGPELWGFPHDFVPSPESLRPVIEAFRQDAEGDLAREGVSLDADTPRAGVRIIVDAAAADLLARRAAGG